MANLTGAFQLFKPSKEMVMNNAMAFLLIIFMPSFLSLIGQILSTNSAATLSSTFSLNATSEVSGGHPLTTIGGLLSLLLLPAGIYIELLAAKGKAIDAWKSFTESLKYFWRLFGLFLLVGLIVICGLILFIVPGVIFIRRYFLAPYFLVDKDMKITDAMKASAEKTKGRPGAVWGIIGVSFLFVLFGIVPIFGGLISLVMLTLYTCAPAIRYTEIINIKA